MQTLTFNTTTKQVQLLDGPRGSSLTLETFDNISTVKVNTTDIQNSLNAVTNVTIQTGLLGSAGSQSGDITVSSAISNSCLACLA